MAVGRYQLVAPIAAGGMAEIWLARQPGVQQFDRMLVIKRLINTFEADQEHIRMFLTEARLAAQLNHPNVVQIFELGEHLGSFFIAMEFLDGENLSTVRTIAERAGHAIPIAIAARLAAMAAEGMHYAHTRTSFDGKPLSIIHRDISPQNLIVTYEGGLKLVDFGIAKVATEATTSGKLKGKIRYMAPEQGRVEQVDERADIFSLGMVLFELVTNTRMFPRLDELELLRNVVSDAPLPRARARRPGLPAALDAIIAKALERRPADRFPSAREMQFALEEFLRAEPQPVGSAEISDYMKGLFKERIADRRRLIQAAMAGEVNPLLVPETFKPPSVSRGGKPRRRAVSALAALVVVSGFGLGMALSKPAPAPAPARLAAVAHAAGPILDLDTRPEGASIEVDGVPRGSAPLALEAIAPGEHTIVATLDRFLPGTQHVTLKPGERVRLIIPLNPQPVASAPPAAARSAAATAKKRGRLNISTKPWTIVYLGKVKLGETPISDAVLPAGKQLLHLVNPEQKIDTTVEVEIKPGETTITKLRL